MWPGGWGHWVGQHAVGVGTRRPAHLHDLVDECRQVGSLERFLPGGHFIQNAAHRPHIAFVVVLLAFTLERWTTPELRTSTDSTSSNFTLCCLSSVWCGAVRCGAVRCGMGWDGSIWSGMWYQLVKVQDRTYEYGTVRVRERHGMSTVRYGTVHSL